MRFLADEMERHKDAQSLNDNVIVPFAAALESVCEARGYVLNIYGEKSNIVFTGSADAEAIYQLIEAYLDSRDGGVRGATEKDGGWALRDARPPSVGGAKAREKKPIPLL